MCAISHLCTAAFAASRLPASAWATASRPVVMTSHLSAARAASGLGANASPTCTEYVVLHCSALHCVGLRALRLHRRAVLAQVRCAGCTHGHNPRLSTVVRAAVRQCSLKVRKRCLARAFSRGHASSGRSGSQGRDGHRQRYGADKTMHAPHNTTQHITTQHQPVSRSVAVA